MSRARIEPADPIDDTDAQVVYVGESEIAENKVTLKNMKTGAQEIMERDQVYMELKKISSS